MTRARLDPRLLVSVLLLGLALRSSIAAVGPVLDDVRRDLGMSAAVAGLLTTLPVLCFAAAAPLAGWLGRRVGLDRAILVGLAAVAVFAAARTAGGTALLLVCTAALGVGMTVGNVLGPAAAKRDFGERAGAVSGLLTASLCAGASVAAVLTAPITQQVGWRVALATWAGLGLLAAVIWPAARRVSPTRPAPVPAPAVVAGRPWRHRGAWLVALFMGFQAFAYYVVTAWLPTILADLQHLDARTAGVGASLYQLLGLGGSLLLTALVARRVPLVSLAAGIGVGWAVMVVGLLVDPALWPLWCVVGGVAQGGGLALAVILTVVKAPDGPTASALSTMAQTVGYAIAATGPVLAGALVETTGGWTAGLGLLLVVVAGLLAFGVAAARSASVPSGVPAVHSTT